MTADSFTSVLEGFRQLQPFRVFTVELHGGRRFEVDHPGALVVRARQGPNLLDLRSSPMWLIRS